MRSTSISKQAITLISGRGLASLFTFLIPVVLTRHLTPSDYGTFKQVFLIYGTLFTVLPFGTIQSLYYFIPKDPDRIKVYLVQSLLFLQVSGLIAMLFLLTLGQKISVYFNNPALAPYLFQLGLFIFLTLSSAYFEALLISSQKINQAAILSFISEACKTGFMLVPLLFWRDLSSLMWGMGLFAFFRFSLTMVYVVRRYSLSWKDFDRPSFRTQLAYALPFGLAVILQVTQDHFHQYVVAYTYSAAVFAVYSVGMFQLPLIELVGAPMSQLLIVRMTSLLRQGGAAGEVLALWRDITKKLAIVFIPAFVFLQVMAREVVIFLFTSAYLPSVPLIRLSAVSLLTAFLLAEGALRAYAQTRFILKVTFIKTALTLLFIFPFLMWFGLLGGLITLTSVLVFAKGVSLWKMSRLVPVSVGVLLPWRDFSAISVFSLLSAVPVFFIKSLHFTSTFSVLSISASVYSLLYLFFLFTSSLISFDEKREMIRMARSLGSRLPAASKY